MPEFISKQQYKYYEKGEYTDQKARDLYETLELIKTFPWDEQRGSGVQLTGPSVTICDNVGNYLKIGLFFGGKFCLYYFTSEHKLYEYRVATLGEIDLIVTNFFNAQLDVEKFERKSLVFEASKYFEDAAFFYQIKPATFYLRFIFAILCFVTLISVGLGIVTSNAPLFAKLIMPSFSLLVVGLLGYQYNMAFKYYNRCKNMFLELPAGNNVFKFGENENIAEYKKSDMVEINMYGPISSKGAPYLNLSELVFANGQTVKLPVMLIDPFVLLKKFHHVKVNYVSKKAEYKKVWSDFASGK